MSEIRFRRMRSAETEAVLELLEEAFGFRELFVRYLERDPALGPEDTLLAVAGERPVACVQIFSKRIRLRGQSVGLGGIGSLGTARDFRGRGLARRLVEAAAEEMRRRRMALALLFTGLVGFYEPLGFVRVPQRRQRLRGGSAASGSLASAERFIDADLPQIRELYEDYTATLEGCTLRDENYWHGQLAYAGNPDEDFRVARRGGRIVAYMRTIPTEGPRVAMEFARASDGAEELSGLLAAGIPADGSLICPRPPDAPLDQELLERGVRAEPLEDPMTFWRALDPERLAELAELPAGTSDAALLRALIGGRSALYWPSDRF